MYYPLLGMHFGVAIYKCGAFSSTATIIHHSVACARCSALFTLESELHFRPDCRFAGVGWSGRLRVNFWEVGFELGDMKWCGGRLSGLLFHDLRASWRIKSFLFFMCHEHSKWSAVGLMNTKNLLYQSISGDWSNVHSYRENVFSSTRWKKSNMSILQVALGHDNSLVILLESNYVV